jgi:hypothetical protein
MILPYLWIGNDCESICVPNHRKLFSPCANRGMQSCDDGKLAIVRCRGHSHMLVINVETNSQLQRNGSSYERSGCTRAVTQSTWQIWASVRSRFPRGSQSPFEKDAAYRTEECSDSIHLEDFWQFYDPKMT